MSETMFTLVSMAIIALTTWSCRAIPFVLLGGKKEINPMIKYLGNVLPAAIMIILVLYCARGLDFSAYPFAAPEIIGVIVAAGVQYKKGNTILSIIIGMIVYMVLMNFMY